MKEKPIYKIGAHIMDTFSDLFNRLAIDAWKKDDYKNAAEFWLKSYIIHGRQETLDWYWKSKKEIENHQKKPF